MTLGDGDNRMAMAFLEKCIGIHERLVNSEGRREFSDELAQAYILKATTMGELGDNRAGAQRGRSGH